MNKTLKRSSVVALVSLGIVMGLFAQTDRSGTATATELLVPIGARDLAMGGAGIATSSGTEAIFWNPAGLGRIQKGGEGMFSTMAYLADIDVNYGAVAGAFGEVGVFGLSIKSLDWGDIPLTTNEDPANGSGKTFSPTMLTVGISYARQISDAVSIGTTVKLVSNTLGRVSQSGFAIDFGVQYSRLIGLEGLSVGVVLKNIGPQMQFEGPGLYQNAVPTDGDRPQQKFKVEAASFELPSTMEVGLGYTARVRDNISYMVLGSFVNDNLDYDSYHFGGHIGFMVNSDLWLFGRGGMQLLSGATNDAEVFGPTFGGGIEYRSKGVDLGVDFAYRTVEFFDGNTVIAIKLGF